jgi:hypothetical protein
MNSSRPIAAAAAGILALAACSARKPYENREMDFGSIKTVAVMPFWNLTRDNLAGDRVRDVYANRLLATGAVYVLPTGEVTRAASRLAIPSPWTPTSDEVVKLGGLLKVDAVITGVLKEYGEVRSANAVANVVSLSIQMQETATGKVIWAGSSTKGGVGWGARLLGTTGGDAVNDIVEQAVDDLLAQLFR